MPERDNPLEFLVKQFEAQTERIKDCMIEQDLVHDEYIRLRGMAQGFAYAVQTIKTLAEQLERDDE